MAIKGRVGNDPFTEFSVQEWAAAVEFAESVVLTTGEIMVGVSADGEELGIAEQAGLYLAMAEALGTDDTDGDAAARVVAETAQALAEPVTAGLDYWKLLHVTESDVAFGAEEVATAVEIKARWRETLAEAVDGVTPDEKLIAGYVSASTGLSEEEALGAWMKFETLLEVAALSSEGVTFSPEL